jgi:hypothetical protein
MEMTEDGFYKRGKFQLSFRSRKFTGCVVAAAVHSLFAVDLNARGAKKLEFYNERMLTSTKQLTDISMFAQSALRTGVPVYGCNTYSPGVMPSIAGAGSFDNTYTEESTVFLNLAGRELIGVSKPPEERYAQYWPEIDDETALACAASAECTCPRNVGPEYRAQLVELRNATVKHLDRMSEKGHHAVCAWNGDCSAKHFTVDRRSNLSLTEFHEEYAMMRRPVVVTDYINGHNRLSTTGEPFDAAYWKRVCGGRHFSIQKANKAKNWGGLTGYVYDHLEHAHMLTSRMPHLFLS